MTPCRFTRELRTILQQKHPTRNYDVINWQPSDETLAVMEWADERFRDMESRRRYERDEA